MFSALSLVDCSDEDLSTTDNEDINAAYTTSMCAHVEEPHSPSPIQLIEKPLGFYETSTACRPRGLLNRLNSCFSNAVVQSLLACQASRLMMRRLVALEQLMRTHGGAEKFPIALALAGVLQQYESDAFKNSLEPVAAPATKANGAGKHSKKSKRQREKKNHKDVGVTLSTTTTTRTVWRRDPILPTEFEIVIGKFVQRSGQQQDVHEFFHYVIESTHAELEILEDELRKIRPENTDDRNTENRHCRDTYGDEEIDECEDINDVQNGWLTVDARNRTKEVTNEVRFRASLASAAFGGSLKIELRKHGATSSLQMVPFFTLQLPLARSHTLEEALRDFSAPEVIDGVRHKKRTVSADTNALIETLPTILVLHMKRFCYDAASRTGTIKIRRHVHFDQQMRVPNVCIDTLTVRKSKSSTLNYTLRTLIVHLGDRSSHGHYIAYVRHDEYGWLRFDDEDVERVTWRHVQEQIAYIIIYERQGAL